MATPCDGPTPARPLPAEPLAEEDAADVLCALAPGAGTRRQAARLARALGGLPPALHLAGRCLRAAAGRPPAPGLPAGFDHYRGLLLARPPDGDRDPPARAQELTLDLLAGLGLPRARPLLRWLACFAPAPLPRAVLDAGVLAASPLFAGVTGAELARSLAALVDFGLLDEVTLRTTRCVLPAPAVRERQRPDERRDHLALCVAVLDGATTHLSATDPEHLSRWTALAPHCEHVVADTALPDRWELPATRLTRGAAVLAHLTGAHDRAQALFARALAARRRHLGDHHPDVLALRRDLAWSRHARADPPPDHRALAEYASLVRDCATGPGPDHPLTLACRLDLAWLASRAAPDEADRCREVVRAEHRALGHHGPAGLAAQLELVAHLWRRAHDTGRADPAAVAAEFDRLHAVIDDIAHHPDVHPDLPVPFDRLRQTAHDLRHAFERRHAHRPPPRPRGAE
ncbi:hypothetical protein [Saccharothrix algeriensis]|uniref:Tetratricopeptide repeat protein n=1 Tax=Saccharothrix algeriensis TaxID=173560 RepID=A0ABS2SFH1_9PSEU|nr:hypothetical protein [Saccharothrix algeriensis]MBM7815012.1 hypothetical protein [Saccharothrix algeriensis]